MDVFVKIATEDRDLMAKTCCECGIPYTFFTVEANECVTQVELFVISPASLFTLGSAFGSGKALEIIKSYQQEQTNT